MEELNPLWLSLMPFYSISWHINQSTNQSINKHILRTYCGPALRMDSKYASHGSSYQGAPCPAGKMSRLCQPLPSPATPFTAFRSLLTCHFSSEAFSDHPVLNEFFFLCPVSTYLPFLKNFLFVYRCTGSSLLRLSVL